MTIDKYITSGRYSSSAGNRVGLAAAFVVLTCTTAPTAESYAYSCNAVNESQAYYGVLKTKIYPRDISHTESVVYSRLHGLNGANLQETTIKLAEYLSKGAPLDLGEDVYSKIEEAGGIWEFI